MASSITIVLRDPVTGAGLAGQLVKLRHATDNFATDIYTLADVTGKAGAYKVDNVDSNRYKLFVNGVEDKSYGGDNGREIFEAADLLFVAGGTMEGNIDMDGNQIRNIPEASNDDEPVRLDQAEEMVDDLEAELRDDLLDKSGGTMEGNIDMDGNALDNIPDATGDQQPVSFKQLIAGWARKVIGYTQFIYATFIFYTTPRIQNDPVFLLDAVNKKFVINHVQDVLNGFDPSAAQRSGNQVLVYPSGTQENNKIYQTLETALINAALFASDERVYDVILVGMGADGAVTLNFNLLPVEIDPFINVMGFGTDVRIIMAEDDYEFSAGENSLSCAILDNVNESAVTGIKDCILYNITFANTFGPGATYNLDGCHLINCKKQDGVTLNFTDCTGNEIQNLDTNERDLLCPITAGGFSVFEKNGDIKPRRHMGRRGADVASASTITLGSGNFFKVTGNTTILNISLTGWSEGSDVTLWFENSLTISSAGNVVNPAGGDIAVSPNEIYEFKMLASSWVRRY